MRAKGLTLMELMVTLVIAAIVLIVAVPSYRSIVQNNRISALGNSFTSAVYLARNMAIKKGTPVSICAAADSSLSSCGSAATWTNGWIVFVDSGANGSVGTSSNIIRVWQAPPTGTTVTATQGRITYASTGFLIFGTGSYKLNISGCYGNNAQTITVASNGGVAIARTAC